MFVLLDPDKMLCEDLWHNTPRLTSESMKREIH